MTLSDDFVPDLVRQLQLLAHDPQQALTLLVDAAQAHPADPRPLLLLGAELMQQGQADRAEAAYTAAVQCAPGFAMARFQLGLLQYTGGRPAVAELTWAPLDTLPEHDCLRLFTQGLQRLARDDLRGARALIERGMQANTGNAPLSRDMQMLLDRLPQSQAAEAPPRIEENHVLLSAYQQPQ